MCCVLLCERGRKSCDFPQNIFSTLPTQFSAKFLNLLARIKLITVNLHSAAYGTLLPHVLFLNRGALIQRQEQWWSETMRASWRRFLLMARLSVPSGGLLCGNKSEHLGLIWMLVKTYKPNINIEQLGGGGRKKSKKRHCCQTDKALVVARTYLKSQW